MRIDACKTGCEREISRGGGGGGERLTDSDGYGEETETCEDVFDEKGLAGSDEGGAHPVVFVIVGVMGSVRGGLEEGRM